MFTDYMSIDFFSLNNDSIDIYTSMVSHISDMWDIFQVKNKANEKMIAKYWISFSICIKAIFM